MYDKMKYITNTNITKKGKSKNINNRLDKYMVRKRKIHLFDCSFVFKKIFFCIFIFIFCVYKHDTPMLDKV